MPGVDPVGTFVGGHGTRVNAVMSEIGEQEKIDIIVFSDKPAEFITNALSPTKVSSVSVDEASKRAIVKVPEDQQSIAIGKGGQNVRLASKLTGYEIDIVADASAPNTEIEEPQPASEAKPPKVVAKPPVPGRIKKKTELESSLIDAIESTPEDQGN